MFSLGFRVLKSTELKDIDCLLYVMQLGLLTEF